MSKTLPYQFLKLAKQNLSKLAMQDSLGKKLTNFELLVASLLMGDYLKSELVEQNNIGVVLPASVGAALANISLSFIGKIPVNLNFTLGLPIMSTAVNQANIKTIITSRRFIDKAKLDLPKTKIIFLEDVASHLKKQWFRKIKLALQVKLLSTDSLWKNYGSSTQSSRDLATIIFSSGTTGEPKGVMLSHDNIAANIRNINKVYPPNNIAEKLLGVLPFFHCFGYTVTLWLPLLRGIPVFYHANPTEGKMVGKIIDRHKISLFVSTPTFCQIYMRNCTKQQLQSLDCLWVGAEKLRDIVYNNFYDKFGIRVQEGYGCTETGPVIAVNVPGSANMSKLGSVGKPLPETEVKILDVDSEQPVVAGKSGLLWVRSPSVMQGYLNLKTDKLDQDGWYNTGDIAKLDEDGFLVLTDRLDRFSKLGGEMVPHIKIEEEVNNILGSASSIVVATPHTTKGEQIGILYVHESIDPGQLHRLLLKSGLPNLWIPKLSNIHKVDTLPVLASGKPDLRSARELFEKLEST